MAFAFVIFSVQVLIALLDGAAMEPCADVRVDEIKRLKLNLHKLLQYSFPDDEDWNRFHWTGLSIESIIEMIASWHNKNGSLRPADNQEVKTDLTKAHLSQVTSKIGSNSTLLSYSPSSSNLFSNDSSSNMSRLLLKPPHRLLDSSGSHSQSSLSNLYQSFSNSVTPQLPHNEQNSNLRLPSLFQKNK